MATKQKSVQRPPINKPVDPPKRRVRGLMVSLQLFQELFTEGKRYGPDHGFIEILEGIPKGARILSADMSPEYLGIRMLVEHESFDEVPEAMLIPNRAVTWSEIPPLLVTMKVDDGNGVPAASGTG